MSGSRAWSKFDKQELVVSRDIVKIKQKDNRGKKQTALYILWINSNNYISFCNS